MMRNEASSSSGGGSRGESVIIDVGRRRSTCGYCQSGRRSSITHGVWANSLTVYDYQDLLDRGWRRSGCFLYKPEMETTCCPAYTIRLRADAFSPSKEQLRVSKRMQRYLDGIWDGKKQDLAGKSGDSQGRAHEDTVSDSPRVEVRERNEQTTKDDELLDYLSKQIDIAVKSFIRSKDLPCDIHYPKGMVKKVSQTKKRRLVEGSEDLLCTSNVSFQLAATLRRAKSNDKDVLLSGAKKDNFVTGSSSDLSPKLISEELANALQHLVEVPDLSIKACNGHLNFYSAVKEARTDNHNDLHLVALSRVSSGQQSKGHGLIAEKPERKKRKLEILLNKSSFDPEEFALYRKYQIRVHDDEPGDVTQQSYRRFLVDTPLIYVPPTGDNNVPLCGFGSFHQQYRIDGQLVAVGVIDILPKCLSSKYLFWDPDFAFLSLGKYSVLQEINCVKENECHCPSLEYYYLGYYIHSCSKMRYKAAYRPSELLCPLRYKWVPFDVAKPLLDRSKYAVLSDYTNMQNGNSLSTQEPEKLLDQQHDDNDGDVNDADVGGDEKMLNPDSDYDSSEDELNETNELAAVPMEGSDLGCLLLGLGGSRVRYQDLKQAIRPNDRVQLENQLLRYMKVVGPQLSERMVYSLGCIYLKRPRNSDNKRGHFLRKTQNQDIFCLLLIVLVHKMEQFRQIGEVLGSMKALMVLQDNSVQINRRQCSLLFDLFNLAFDTLTEEIKQNLRLEEKNTKWKALVQPLKELHRVFKEAELYVKQCMDCKNWWAKAMYFHNNQDGVEFHLHNLLCYFAIVVEAIETAGEISGLDVDEMKKKRIMLLNKYDMTWNDSKLFLWKYGKQYLISQDVLHRMNNAWKEDKWLLLEMIKERKMSSSFSLILSKQEQRLSDLLLKKINGEELLCNHTWVLTGAKDYQVRRRLGGGMQYKEIQWLGESFALRHCFGEPSELNSEISSLLSLSHPNVVQYICGFHDEEKKEYFLVLELMNKDLNTYIKEVCGSKRQMPFSYPAAVDVMLQIAKGMEYLHSKKIYHGDLNPSNVLIKPRNSSSEGYFHAKISGFGLKGVKTVPSRNSSTNQSEVLPFIWHAPEVLSEQERQGRGDKHKYSEKADVYSFGMLCFEVLTGKVPFEDGHLQGDKMSRNIKAGERPLFPSALPKYLAILTKRCWQTDPTQRPSFSSICRILRYVKRLIVMDPHFEHPEIPSILQVDICDIEIRFMKNFPSEATVALTPVSQIPFQLFSYRLAEKEKLNGINRDKSWESHSEVAFPSNMDEMVNTSEGKFSPAFDTKSMCLEIPEKRLSVFRRLNGMPIDEQILQTQETSSVCEEMLEKKLPTLRKSNSVASGQSSLQVQQAKSAAFSEIPENKPSPLKKYNTIPSLESPAETRAACSVSPAKKVSDKQGSFLRTASSVRKNKDSGKANGKMKGPSFLSPQGHSARTTTERQQPQSMSQKACRCKR